MEGFGRTRCLAAGGRKVGQADDECGDRALGVGPVDIDRFEVRDPVLITSVLSGDPAQTLTRLKCSRAEIERGRRIGRFRDRWPDVDSAVEVRRWMSRVGEAVDDLVCLAQVQGAAGVFTPCWRSPGRAPRPTGRLRGWVQRGLCGRRALSFPHGHFSSTT